MIFGHGILTLILLATFSWSSFAAVKLLTVVNASNSILTSGTTPVIYGGVAGTCAAPDDLTTCNSCDGLTSLQVCNRKRIYDTLELELSFRFDDANKQGRPILTNSDKTVVLSPVSTPDSVSTNETGSIRVLWRDVCTQVGGATSCEDGFAGTTMNLVIDENSDGIAGSSEIFLPVSVQVENPDAATASIDDCDASGVANGVCDFTVYPGDEKVYIEDPGFATGFPNGTGIKLDRLRFLYSTTSFADVHSGTETFKDIQIEAVSSDFQLADDRVDGLENGQAYFFRVGAVDLAENLQLITSDTAINTYCVAPAESDVNCRFWTTPDKVLGLLTEDVNCFIATAAYGSAWAPPLVTFREFRNKILLTSDWGRSFNRWYYKFGSMAAHWLNQYEWLRTLTRLALYPVWAFAWISLRIGFAISISLLGLIGISGILALLVRRRRTRGL